MCHPTRLPSVKSLLARPISWFTPSMGLSDNDHFLQRGNIMDAQTIERAKVVEELIVKVWGSLESHLGYTHMEVQLPESNTFHVECVREYSEMLVLLSKLY